MTKLDLKIENSDSIFEWFLLEPYFLLLLTNNKQGIKLVYSAYID